MRAGNGTRTRDLLLGKETFYQLNYARKTNPASGRECREPESNWRHHDFQSCALPTELSRPNFLPIKLQSATILLICKGLVKRRYRTPIRRLPIANGSCFIPIAGHGPGRLQSLLAPNPARAFAHGFALVRLLKPPQASITSLPRCPANILFREGSCSKAIR